MSVVAQGASGRMPAVFIGHGSPMNTLETNRFTQSWHDLAQSMARPSAILAISAHWYLPALAVTSMESPRTIHDFSGFPPELFAYEYPAPGSPGLARRIADVLSPRLVQLDESAWGLDHGTWSVLAQMYPDADIPVVQLSLDSRLDACEQMSIGAALASLRDEGVLILGSGNVVHNLGLLDWSSAEAGFDWAERFDDVVRSVMTTDPSALPSVMTGSDWQRSAPTPEHFLPLTPIAGIAAATGQTAEVVVEGATMGSLTMTSYLVR